MVEAIDVRTSGLGGDSAVRTDKTEIAVGPERRVPISLASSEHVHLVVELQKQLAEPPSRDLAGVFVQRVERRVEDEAGDVVDAVDSNSRRAAVGELSVVERRVYARSEVAPRPVVDVSRGALERKALDDLAEKGLVQIVGFTPSDAAHVLGMQDNWGGDAALAGAELLAWYTGEDPVEFCRRVWSETVRRSAGCVLDVAFDDAVPAALANPLSAAVASGDGRRGAVSVSFSLDTPLVAVGGPASVYYPEVANRIGANVVLPDDFSVANAVGAAVGNVVARGHSEVHADGPGSYRLVSPGHTSLSNDAVAAIEAATELARLSASAELAERTTDLVHGPVEERVDIVRHDDPNADDERSLYGATIAVELRCRPCSP